MPEPSQNQQKMQKCPKCSSTNFEQSQVRMSGGGLASIMDIGTKKFNTVTCQECGYTEFYSTKHSTGEKVADLLFG